MDRSRSCPQPRVRLGLVGAALATIGIVVAACSGAATPAPPAGAPAIVVTFPVLGAVVRDLVGDGATVTVLMENGVDPHDWAPSAKDIEAVEKADLVVANGLALEEGLDKTLDEAERRGIPVFRATDHITVRQLGGEQGPGARASVAPGGSMPEASAASASDPSASGQGAGDPHFWVDPLAMRSVVAALATAIEEEAGLDLADRAADLEGRLEALDAEVRATLATVPEARRKLVTGHESMGYFADRYGFELIGSVIPGLTTQGEVSAGQLAALKAAIEQAGIPAIFAEVGTPRAVVEAIARETGVTVVELSSHTLPADGSYFSFIREIAATIAEALR